eukprot:scaffold94988_cov54-Phaeocystis_antarctica.AAC.2
MSQIVAQYIVVVQRNETCAAGGYSLSASDQTTLIVACASSGSPWSRAWRRWTGSGARVGPRCRRRSCAKSSPKPRRVSRGSCGPTPRTLPPACRTYLRRRAACPWAPHTYPTHYAYCGTTGLQRPRWQRRRALTLTLTLSLTLTLTHPHPHPHPHH